jgi:hypothetical protein
MNLTDAARRARPSGKGAQTTRSPKLRGIGMAFARAALLSIIALALVLAMPSVFTRDGGASAAPDSNGNGKAADGLTIMVGYAGHPYTERKSYTPESLMRIGGEVKQLYTWIDRMPAPCINPARGVKLADILKDAGIDYASAERIHFTCNDEHETEELTAPYLFDVTKYYYPNLFEYWDYENAKSGVGADADRIRVDTIIAVEDVWQRVLSPDDKLVGFEDMDGERRFRLVFGMTDTDKQTAYNSAMWITSIEVMLAGSPPEETNDDSGQDAQKDVTVGSDKGSKPDSADIVNPPKDSTGSTDSAGGKSGKTKTKKSKNEKGGSENAESATPTAITTAAVTEPTPAAPAEIAAAANSGTAGSRSQLAGKTLKELTIDGDGEGADADAADGAYQPWRTHDMSDEAEALKAAGLKGGLEGPVGAGLGGLAGIGAWLYVLGVRRGLL